VEGNKGAMGNGYLEIAGEWRKNKRSSSPRQIEVLPAKVESETRVASRYLSLLNHFVNISK